MQPQTVTLIVAGLGIGGTLGGILVGHLLTRSWQRKQWLLDNRKEEFKEIVTAMATYVVEHMSYEASKGSGVPQSMQSYVDAMKSTSIVLCDRIYIYEALDRTDIPKRFLAIMEHFRETGTDFDKPADEATKLLKELIALARKG